MECTHRLRLVEALCRANVLRHMTNSVAQIVKLFHFLSVLFSGHIWINLQTFLLLLSQWFSKWFRGRRSSACCSAHMRDDLMALDLSFWCNSLAPEMLHSEHL